MGLFRMFLPGDAGQSLCGGLASACGAKEKVGREGQVQVLAVDSHSGLDAGFRQAHS